MFRLWASVALAGMLAIAGITAGQNASSLRVSVLHLELRDPYRYQVSCELQPQRQLSVRTPMNSHVVSVDVKLGQSVKEGDRLIQLDQQLAVLEVDRAKLALQSAQTELASLQAAGAPANKLTGSETDVKLAQFDLQQAEYWLGKTEIKAPFSGQIIQIPADKGQYVTLGQDLVTISDYATVVVWFPMDTRNAKLGERTTVNVEGADYTGIVRAVLPLIDTHRPLSRLRSRLSTTVIEIANRRGRLKPGQTVGCPLSPYGPLATIPNDNIQRATQGDSVQVLRGNVVQQVFVQRLVSYDSNHTTVSGAFYAGDRLIVSSTRSLSNGTRIASENVEQP